MWLSHAVKIWRSRDCLSVTLNVTFGTQTVSVPLPGHIIGPEAFASVRAAAIDAVPSTEPFRARYPGRDGEYRIFSEDTFDDFLATAARRKGTRQKVLSLEVLHGEGEEPRPSTEQSLVAWQEDPRDLEELLAQFSSEEEAASAAQTARSGIGRNTKKARRRKKLTQAGSKNGISESAHEGGGRVQAEDRLSDPDTQHTEAAQASQVCEDEGDDISSDKVRKSKSCPCLPTCQMDQEEAAVSMYERYPEDPGSLWPATPEHTPPLTPRRSFAAQHVVSLPRYAMVMLPITAIHCLWSTYTTEAMESVNPFCR